MRITNKMMVGNAVMHMDENLERLNSLQEKIASGKQFQTMSDDPAKAASVLSLRSSLQASQNYIDNDNVVNDWLSANELGLKQMVDIGTRAKNLTLQGVSDTMGSSERNALATEIDQIIDQAVSAANSQNQGKYIFAGFRSKSATPPFAINAARTAVTATVDTHSIQVDISPGQTMTTNFVGSAIFDPIFRALIGARDALRSNDSTQIQAAQDTLSTAMDPITTARTTNGGRMRQLKLTLDAMGQTQVELKSLLSSKEDLNMAEAISQLRLQETTYQSVLEVSSRAISTATLFETMG
jgi:flagellar hook-associated protein 3 FlgL